jgi:hypothetical protein
MPNNCIVASIAGLSVFAPFVRDFRGGYHWSFMQVEYATDVIFHRQAQFQPLYDAITRTAVQAIKAEHLTTFLGRKLTSGYQDELGNDFSTRIQGTRLRHHMGAASIKLYDKLGIMARVECTANDVAFFKHHRWVEQRDGNRVFKLAPLRKNIYSLRDLRKLLNAANDRYLAFMAAIDNPDVGLKAIDKMAKPTRHNARSYRGFNLFLDDDLKLFLTLGRGEWTLSGFRAADLRAHIPGLSAGRSSSLLKRLRTHGLIKKVGHRYKYYLTQLGRRVLVATLKLREYVVVPSLCAPA